MDASAPLHCTGCERYGYVSTGGAPQEVQGSITLIPRSQPVHRYSFFPANDCSRIARQQAAAVDAKGSITKSEFTKELPPTIEKLFEDPTSKLIEATKEDAVLAPGWVRAGGALGRLVRELDWANTPLGPWIPVSPRPSCYNSVRKRQG